MASPEAQTSFLPPRSLSEPAFPFHTLRSSTLISQDEESPLLSKDSHSTLPLTFSPLVHIWGVKSPVVYFHQLLPVGL